MDAHRNTGPTVNPGISSVVPSCPSPCQRVGCPRFSASYIDFFLDGALAGGAAGSCFYQRAASWAVVCPPLSDPELNWECGKDIILISERRGCHLLNSVSWWSHLLWTRLSPALASGGRAWSLQQQQLIECKPGMAVGDACQMLRREHPGRLPDSLGGCQRKLLGGKNKLEHVLQGILQFVPFLLQFQFPTFCLNMVSTSAKLNASNCVHPPPCSSDTLHTLTLSLECSLHPNHLAHCYSSQCLSYFLPSLASLLCSSPSLLGASLNPSTYSDLALTTVFTWPRSSAISLITVYSALSMVLAGHSECLLRQCIILSLMRKLIEWWVLKDN